VTLVRERTIPTVGPLVPTFADIGSRVVSATDPHGNILCFLDRSRYYFFQVALQRYSWGWVDPVPDPLLLKKSGRVGNRTRELWICNQKLCQLDHRGGTTRLYITKGRNLQVNNLNTMSTWRVLFRCKFFTLYRGLEIRMVNFLCYALYSTTLCKLFIWVKIRTFLSYIIFQRVSNFLSCSMAVIFMSVLITQHHRRISLKSTPSNFTF
jgi:hypothetical protein